MSTYELDMLGRMVRLEERVASIRRDVRIIGAVFVLEVVRRWFFG